MSIPMGSAQVQLTPRGFTLIELLVVVAIIGILTAITLAALGNSRSKAGDSSIKSSLSIIRSQAEIYALANGNSYGSFNGGVLPAIAGASSPCLTEVSGNLFADPTIKAAMVSAQAASGGNMRCFADGANWQVAVALKTAPGTSWCVASNGVAKTMPTANVLDPVFSRSCLQ